MDKNEVCSSASSDKARRRDLLQITPADVLGVAAAAPALVLPATVNDIDALLTAHAAAEVDAYAADTLERSPAYKAAERRCKELYDAIMNARPTDPIAMAKQIRFLMLGSRNLKSRMLRHIADQLEAMRPAPT
jgi:hypothetical protein